MTTETPSMDRRSLLRSTVMVAGAAVALPAMASLAGCSSAPPTLTSHQALITTIADRIIPQTDTPGAIAAGVPEYVAAVFGAHFTEDQQSNFAGGLQAIADFAEDEGVTSFENANADQMDAMLTKLASGEAGGSASAAWTQLRDMVIFGFYTSEEATQELSYEEIPGRYEACLPLAEVGNAWLDRGV